MDSPKGVVIKKKSDNAYTMTKKDIVWDFATFSKNYKNLSEPTTAPGTTPVKSKPGDKDIKKMENSVKSLSESLAELKKRHKLKDIVEGLKKLYEEEEYEDEKKEKNKEEKEEEKE